MSLIYEVYWTVFQSTSLLKTEIDVKDVEGPWIHISTIRFYTSIAEEKEGWAGDPAGGHVICAYSTMYHLSIRGIMLQSNLYIYYRRGLQNPLSYIFLSIQFFLSFFLHDDFRATPSVHKYLVARLSSVHQYQVSQSIAHVQGRRSIRQRVRLHMTQSMEISFLGAIKSRWRQVLSASIIQ